MHPLIKYLLTLSADVSVNVLAEYWSTRDRCIGWHVDRYVGLHSTDMVNGVSADTWLCVSQHVGWYMANIAVVT